MSAHAILDLERHPADFHTGFELGRDHARFRVTPPAQQLLASSPVYQGFRAGQRAFGSRARPANRHVRRWLELRLRAWLRGDAFEDIQVTPNHLAQIDVEHCPISRLAFEPHAGEPGSPALVRVRDDAAYAAGNLALVCSRVAHAKAGCDFSDAASLARRSAAAGASIDGLAAVEWARLASLLSYVSELPHEQALELPLAVLPPNRLRLLNPIQSLQVLVTLQFAQPGYSARVDRIEQLVPGAVARRDFRLFFVALLPRVLEAGRLEAQALRWALEDAWRDPLVNTCWQRFARQISAPQAETIVARAAQRPALMAPRFVSLTHEQATDGWALPSGGSITPIRLPRVVSPALAPTPAAAAATSDAEKHATAAAANPAARRSERPAPRQATLDLALH